MYVTFNVIIVSKIWHCFQEFFGLYSEKLLTFYLKISII